MEVEVVATQVATVGVTVAIGIELHSHCSQCPARNSNRPIPLLHHRTRRQAQS